MSERLQNEREAIDIFQLLIENVLKGNVDQEDAAAVREHRDYVGLVHSQLELTWVEDESTYGVVVVPEASELWLEDGVARLDLWLQDGRGWISFDPTQAVSELVVRQPVISELQKT